MPKLKRVYASTEEVWRCASLWLMGCEPRVPWDMIAAQRIIPTEVGMIATRMLWFIALRELVLCAHSAAAHTLGCSGFRLLLVGLIAY